MKTLIAGMGLLGLVLLAPAQTLAATPLLLVDTVAVTAAQEAGLLHLVQEDSDYDGAGDADLPIKPREAANIAKDQFPGSRVLKVKLLPSGVYAVTLRGNGALTRVMVDGQTGAVN